MRPPEEIKKEIVRQWLSKADQDLSASKALLVANPPFLYPSCFHAQQAAEKYLKALLTWYQIEFPKTHIIEELLDLVEQADSSMSSNLQDAVLLTPYGVDIRYPGETPEPGLKETQEAVALAQKVRDTVMDRLEGIL